MDFYTTVYRGRTIEDEIEIEVRMDSKICVLIQI